jgi:target of rapamycin complex 2 subunit MAPKAP1
MELSVRKDASVEEVLGFALWTYWEEEWMPPLDSSLPPPPAGGAPPSSPDEEKNEREREALLSALGWVLLIAEEDGEVDDDFPAPNRTGKVSTFNAEAFAVVEASEQQRRQNELVERGIVRRVSRIVGGKSGGAGGAGAGAAAAAAGGGVKKVAVNGATSQTALVGGGTNGTAATGPSTATGTSPATGTAAKEGNITTVSLSLTHTYQHGVYDYYDYFLVGFCRQHNRQWAKTRTSTRTSPPQQQLGTCRCLYRLVGLWLVSLLPSYPHFLPRLVPFLPHLPTYLPN